METFDIVLTILHENNHPFVFVSVEIPARFHSDGTPRRTLSFVIYTERCTTHISSWTFQQVWNGYKTPMGRTNFFILHSGKRIVKVILLNKYSLKSVTVKKLSIFILIASSLGILGQLFREYNNYFSNFFYSLLYVHFLFWYSRISFL